MAHDQSILTEFNYTLKANEDKFNDNNTENKIKFLKEFFKTLQKNRIDNLSELLIDASNCKKELPFLIEALLYSDKMHLINIKEENIKEAFNSAALKGHFKIADIFLDQQPWIYNHFDLTLESFIDKPTLLNHLLPKYSTHEAITSSLTLSTLLDKSIEKGHLESAKVIMNHGQRDIDFKSAIHTASASKIPSKEMLKLIIDAAKKHNQLPSGKELTEMMKQPLNQDLRKILVKNGANPKDLKITKDFTKEAKQELAKIHDTRKEITHSDKKEVYKLIKAFTKIIENDKTLKDGDRTEAVEKLEKTFEDKFKDKSSQVDIKKLEALAEKLSEVQKNQPQKSILSKLWEGLKSIFRSEYQNLKLDVSGIKNQSELKELKSSLKKSIVEDVEKKSPDNRKNSKSQQRER